MHVFEVWCDGAYAELQVAPGHDEAFRELCNLLNAADRGPLTQPLPAPALVFDSSGRPEPDLVEFGSGSLLLNDHAMDALGEYVCPLAELYSLGVAGRDWTLAVIRERISALDLEKSKVEYYAPAVGQRRIWRIHRHVFIEEAIGNRALFRLDCDLRWLYATDTFVHAVTTHVVRGLTFMHLYPPPTRQELEEYYRSRRARKRNKRRG